MVKGLTREEIEEIQKTGLVDSGDIDALCDLALRALEPSPERELQPAAWMDVEGQVISLSELSKRPVYIREAWEKVKAEGRITELYAHSPAPRATEQEQKSEEQHVLDAMCHATGYQRWWINAGKLFFERDGELGRIDVLVVAKALVATEQAWIPVGERLPEAIYAGDPPQQSENVLVLFMENGMDGPYQVVACYWHDTKRWDAAADESGTYFEYATVIGWMPLPPAPSTSEPKEK